MLKRNIVPELQAYLKLMPVVLLTGARQTGKTTLIQSITEHSSIPLYTFDDEFTLSNAKRDPSGWLQSLPKPVVIDEVQRVPEIFLPIKQDVDQNRKPGRYLLTGSANPLLLPRLSDSLAGRMGIVNLYPFSQGELHQLRETFLSSLFGEGWHPAQEIEALPVAALHQIVLKGGFPTVQPLQDLVDVNRWVRSYLQTIMERDVRDIANVAGLRDFPRLFHLLATRSAQLLNHADIARSLDMVQTTLHRYMRLLETLYFVFLLPAWYTNLGKRFTKSPKIHVCDTAILSQLIGIDAPRLQEDPRLFGHFLESFVFSEILKQKSWSSFPFEMYHFRNGDFEVDLVLEKPDKTMVGIEIKSSRQLDTDDWKGLKHLQELNPKHFKRGVILHLGNRIEQLSDHLWALPIQMLWT
ncbi:MAG: ATP-binding protein [Chlamydiia bacterium]|nr:ATP-binding protein [Chlamydiia bacterium]